MVKLGFEPDVIGTTQYEVGVLIPTSITHDDLKEISHEIEEWIFVVERLDELVRGQPAPTIPVRSLSSGSFDLFLSVDPNGAWALLLLAGGIYKMFQYVRDAAKRREEMTKANYPEKYVDLIHKYEDELIEAGKKEILEKLLKRKSNELPEHRIHELTTGLKHAIEFVLHSMNSGVDVEVSTPPEPAAEAEKAGIAAEVKQIQDEIEKLRIEMTAIVGQLPDRSKPILQLPDISAERTTENANPAKPLPKTFKRAKKNKSTTEDSILSRPDVIVGIKPVERKMLSDGGHDTHSKT